MRILGIAGSLRGGLAQPGLLLEAAELLPAGVELVLYDGLKAVPPYDEDDDVEPAPVRRSPSLRDAVVAGRRDALRDPGVQRVGSRPAEERRRLASRPRGAAVPAAASRSRSSAPSTGAFGARLGAGRAAQGAGAPPARASSPARSPFRAPTPRLEEDGRLLDDELRERLAELRRRPRRRGAAGRAARRLSLEPETSSRRRCLAAAAACSSTVPSTARAGRAGE